MRSMTGQASCVPPELSKKITERRKAGNFERTGNFEGMCGRLEALGYVQWVGKTYGAE